MHLVAFRFLSMSNVEVLGVFRCVSVSVFKIHVLGAFWGVQKVHVVGAVRGFQYISMSTVQILGADRGVSLSITKVQVIGAFHDVSV